MPQVSRLLVQYGPWVPKPVQPPLARPVTVVITETKHEKPWREPQICAVVKAVNEAASARDEILGL